MFFNKIYSSSTEHIVGKPSSNNTFDIELQQPQPRRRQNLDHDHHHVNDLNKDQNYPRAYSLPARQHEFHSSEPDQLPSTNNIVTIPTHLPTISSSDPILIPSLPVVIEEK